MSRASRPDHLPREPVCLNARQWLLEVMGLEMSGVAHESQLVIVTTGREFGPG